MKKEDQFIDDFLGLAQDELTGVFVRHVGLMPESAWVEAISQRVAWAYGPTWRAAIAGADSANQEDRRASALLVALILSDYASRIKEFCDTLDAPGERPLSILDRMPNHIAVVLENARKSVHTPSERPQDGARSHG